MSIVESIMRFFRGGSDCRPRQDYPGESRRPSIGKSADEILKEIVDTINSMNNRLMSLERAMEVGGSQKGRARRGTDVRNERSRAMEQPNAVQRVPVQETIPAIDSLERQARHAENFLDRCEAVVRLLSKKRNEASDRLARECKSVIEKVRSDMSRSPSLSLAKDDYYRNLSETLRSIRLMDLTIYLCNCAEDEMEGKSENDTQQLLHAMAELVGLTGHVFICPKLGERYDGNEHDVIGQERDSGFPAGSIARVHTRGFKGINGGMVIKKARISLAM